MLLQTPRPLSQSRCMTDDEGKKSIENGEKQKRNVKKEECIRISFSLDYCSIDNGKVCHCGVSHCVLCYIAMQHLYVSRQINSMIGSFQLRIYGTTPPSTNDRSIISG